MALLGHCLPLTCLKFVVPDLSACWLDPYVTTRPALWPPLPFPPQRLQPQVYSEWLELHAWNGRHWLSKIVDYWVPTWVTSVWFFDLLRNLLPWMSLNHSVVEWYHEHDVQWHFPRRTYDLHSYPLTMNFPCCIDVICLIVLFEATTVCTTLVFSSLVGFFWY